MKAVRATLLLLALAVMSPAVAQDGPGGDKDRPPQPPACKTDADCSKKCGPDAKGCTCHTTRRGDRRCAPSCKTDADCPSGKDGRGVCREGVCRPPRGKDGKNGKNQDGPKGQPPRGER